MAIDLDFGGTNLKVETIEVNVTKPGETGSSLSTAELIFLDGAAAANSGTNKAVITGTSGALTVAGALTTSAAVIGGVQALSGPGAVNLTTLITTVATTGADALTLADGTVGQLKIITMITDGGDGTLTPTNLAGGNTITFSDVGDSVLLVFVDGEWQIVANNGCTVA